MKCFQLRLANEVHDTIKFIANERQTTVADIVRQSIELFIIITSYSNRKLILEDSDGSKMELAIPGITGIMKGKK